MKSKKIVVAIIAALLVIIIGYSFFGKDSGQSYEAEVVKERTAKNDFMRSSDESPFGEEKKNFKQLNYFPVDLNYRINAKLEPIENKKIVELPSSDGQAKKYSAYAYALFELRGVPCRLLILEMMDEGPYRGTLFLAFADSTSARETYGAGRYLDLKKTPGASSVTLDFNQAYNPYCAYAENYSCPFPPKENSLKIAVRAGEKKYHD